MLICMSLSTMSSLLQHPLAVVFGRDSAHLAFIVLRLLNGVGSAAFLPVYTSMLTNWSPPLERSRMMGTVFAGGNLGTQLNATVILFRRSLQVSNVKNH